MSDLSSETLLNLGFVDVAAWTSAGDEITYRLDGPHAEANQVRLDARNALYAFVQDSKVQYIGKTARTIRKRFVGYRRPARQQRTNWRCNGKIKEALARGAEVRIFVFTPISQLRYSEFEINLAAGLENSLIAEFDPPWNGREHGHPVTEEAEREEEGGDAPLELPASENEPAPNLATGALASFTILLGKTYYDEGLINPGVEASQHLGPDGEPIQVVFDDDSEPVLATINRTANRSGAVRVVGGKSAHCPLVSAALSRKATRSRHEC